MSIGLLWHAVAEPLSARLRPGRQRLRELRARWAQPGSGEGAFHASWYFERQRKVALHAGAGEAAFVDDRTWGDLEFPRIFDAIDTTLTPPGRQMLYSQLRGDAGPAGQAGQRYALCTALRDDAVLRERIQLLLLSLKDEAHANIAGFVFGEAPEAPAHRGLLAAWGLASLLVLLSTMAWGWPVWIWLGMLTINAVVAYRSMWRVFRHTATLKSCLRLLRVADALGRIRGGVLAPLAQLAAQAPQRAQARASMRWLALLQQPALEDLGIPLWLTLAFLAEPVAYAYSVRHFERVRPALAAAFQQVGELDAAIATASWLASQPQHCQPGPAREFALRLIDGRHPLVARPVPNSLELDGRSLLITGSNMAGKTTFVKMVAINVILGRSLGFCLASEACLPPGPVMTSIRSEHSVASGKSHYFAEVEAACQFVAVAERGDRPLLVLDEPFRGTNTRERVALVRALLEHLARHATVLVTTHDVELQGMLAGQYALCHFRECPDVEGFFDYRLRPGASGERNAIRVLARMDFPRDIVAAAMAYATQRDGAVDEGIGRHTSDLAGG